VSSDGLGQSVRQQLLALARQAIELELLGLAVADADLLHPHLQPRRGAFVTLRRSQDGELRGCVGMPEPLFPLGRAVVRAAASAAFRDPRFSPVTASEVSGLTVQVSVLFPLVPLAATEVVVGTHGLVVRYAGRSGLLLPQVAVAQGWDRETFLEHTCRKAGLPRDAWRKADCEVLGFTAEVFGED